MATASTLERGVAVVACPACGVELDPDWCAAIGVTDRYGCNWWLSTCRACGLEWQTFPLTTDARKHFYGSGLYRQLCEQVTGKPWTNPKFLHRAQQEYADKWLQKWDEVDMMCQGADYQPPFDEGKWLDFGGSTGIVSSKWASAHKYSPKRVDVVVADYGDGATTTPEEALTQGPYDSVLCCQTLDHLPNPLEMLRTFRDVTRDGGTLFVDVVKKSHTAYKVDHDTYWPSAACFVACVERAGWTVDWLDGETNPTHWTIGAHR
jgi:hypothetical protein